MPNRLDAPPPWAPRLGPVPRGFGWSLLALAAAAAAMCAPVFGAFDERLIGDGLRPDVGHTASFAWWVHRDGLLSLGASARLAWPARLDRLALSGFPLDLLTVRPFYALLGPIAGLNAWTITLFWSLGAAVAWLAARWWRAAAAGLAAGLVAMTSSVMVWEVVDGRPNGVFSTVFLVLGLGLLADALLTQRSRTALGAGLCFGVCALAWWFGGVLVAFGALVLIALTRAERRPVLRVLFDVAGPAALLVVAPLAYQVLRLDQQPGVSYSPWTVIQHGNTELLLADLVERRALSWSDIGAGHIAARPLVLGLALAGALVGPGRRRAAPLAWLGIGLALVTGPWWGQWGDTPIPGPFLFLLELPLVGRWWWPDRAWFLAVPALALFVGGAVARLGARAPALAWATGAILFAEALVQTPTLPVPTWDARPSPLARALATQGDAPVLVLPSPAGVLRLDTRTLYDQVHHGRPLVNGPLHPFADNAPAPWRSLAQEPALKHLFACETTDPPTDLGGSSPESLRASLRLFGLGEVIVDPRSFANPQGRPNGYRDCIEALLGDPDTLWGSHLVYTLEDDLALAALGPAAGPPPGEAGAPGGADGGPMGGPDSVGGPGGPDGVGGLGGGPMGGPVGGSEGGSEGGPAPVGNGGPERLGDPQPSPR